MKVALYMEDWMLTMGMVGLKRILQDDVEQTPYGLLLETEVLKTLPERFFNYMLKQYSVAERDKKRMDENLKWAENEKYFKNNLQQIRQRMSEQYKKVEKYFKDTKEAAELRCILDTVKKIKKPHEHQTLEEQVEAYYSLAKTDFIDTKLTINYFKTSVMTPFFGQVSFLNVCHNAKSKKEQLEIFKKDYIDPVLLEAGLMETVENANDVGEIKDYLNENNNHKPFRSMFQEIKKRSLVEEVRLYLSEEYPQCELIDGQFATDNFEEMIFSPLGVSRKEGFNFNWDLNKGQPVPLSVLARLVLLMAPVGVTFYGRKEGFGEQGKTQYYAGFVMSDDTFPEVFNKNETYRIKKENEDPFNVIVHDLLQQTRERAGKVMDTLLFIELFSDYQGKKTLLDYYHMPRYVAYYFRHYGDVLRKINSSEYREAFTRAVLQGIEPMPITYRYLRSLLEKNQSGYGGYIVARESNRIQALKKGVRDLKNDDKKVYVIFKQGQEIRNSFIATGEMRAEEAGGEYTAGGSKKVNSIAYRLLNASKAGNKKSFMDTVFRLHMAAEKEMSPIFLNALHEKEIKFDTVASAFIAGLLSEDYEKEPKKEAASSDE